MAHTVRNFGRPAPLHALMQRGEEFFDAINSTDIDSVLVRSKRIGRIALTAAAMAGEKLQLEGDTDGKQLVFAAYLGIGDITARAVADTSPVRARELLTTPQTHRTLLLASKALKSYAFDRMAKQYRHDGSGFDLNDQGLTFQNGLTVHNNEAGKGCPYALGDPRRAAYFTLCADNIVHTYTEAYERNMPANLIDQILHR